MKSIEHNGIETHKIEWHNCNIELRWSPRYLTNYPIAHLEIRSENSCPIPITETGYRSHFCQAEEVMSEG
jgi:hypothetical protein